MTTDILKTISKEKLLLKKWSLQVDELEQFNTTDQQKNLYENLKENIRNKMQLIEDLEFEALENQITLEESQPKTPSSSTSSSLSQSMSSNVISATSFPSDEKIELDPCDIINRDSCKQFHQTSIPVSCDTSNKLALSEISNDDEAFSSSNTKDRLMSLTSSTDTTNNSSDENNYPKLPRLDNEFPSVESRISFRKKNNSRPLTRFLPNLSDPQFHLRSYVEQCGHDLRAAETFVKIDTHSCSGHLLKLSGKRLKLWKKKSFIFDRNRRILAYYTSHTSRKIKGMISFDQILSVQALTMSSSDVKHVFSIQLIDNFNRGRKFKEELKLSAQTAECQRIWMDVLFTGAEGYLKTLNENRNQMLSENNKK